MHAGIASLEPRQLSLVSYSVLGLVAAALFSYVIVPQWRAYQAATTSLQLLQTSAADGSSLVSQLDTLHRDVNILERTLNGDASNLPVRKMEAFVIGRLQTISWSNDMELIGVQPRQGVPLNQFSELIFDVELEGGYFDFFEWLKAIGEELGFVVVKRFEMASVNETTDSGEPRLKVKLTIASYRNQRQ